MPLSLLLPRLTTVCFTKKNRNERSPVSSTNSSVELVEGPPSSQKISQAICVDKHKQVDYYYFTIMTTCTDAPEDVAICPHTLKPISSIDKSELAVINPEQSECGHKCSLPHLVSYVHDANVGSTRSCPVCLQSKVMVVCDGNADRLLRKGKDEIDVEEQQFVCLRYGPIHYYLSLRSSSSRIPTSSALSRIEAVLGVDVKQMKIIHNGKIIFPDKTNSNQDVSEKIVSISSLDIAKKRKKPSLVVMGVRKQQAYSKGSISNATVGVKDILLAIVSMLTPTSLWRNISWGMGWTINTTKSLLGGLYLFAQSMLFPPQHRNE